MRLIIRSVLPAILTALFFCLPSHADDDSEEPETYPTPLLLESLRGYLAERGDSLPDPELIETYAFIGEQTENNGDDRIALEMYKRAFDYAMQIDSLGLASSMATNSIALLSRSNLYDEAIAYTDSVWNVLHDPDLRHDDRVWAENHPDNRRHGDFCLYLLQWKAGCEYSMGYADDAIATSARMVDMVEATSGKDSYDHLKMLSQYAVPLSLKNPVESLRIMEEVAPKMAKVAEPDDPAYQNFLLNLTQSLIDMGNYAEAEKYLIPALAALDAKDTAAAKQYGYLGHSKAAIIYYFTGRSDLCDAEMEKARSIYKEIYGDRISPAYCTLLHNHSVFLRHANPRKALDLELESTAMRREIFGEYHKDYIGSLNNLCDLYESLGETEKAYDTIRTALDLTEKALGKNSFEYLTVLSDYFDFFSHHPEMIGEDDNLAEYLNGFMPTFKNNVRRNFQLLSSAERDRYWTNISPYLQGLYNLAGKTEMPEAIMTAYDALLFQKGILLSTDMEFQRLLKMSDDPEVKRLVSSINDNNMILQRASEMEAPARDALCDSLLAANKKSELELQSRILSYGDFTSIFDIATPEIKRSLKETDVAIEFMRSGDSLGALVLSPENLNPVYVKICAMEDARDKSDLFLPLMPYLEGKSAIYFSPTGILHTVPLESLPVPGDESVTMDDRWELYRLSSTRELARRRHSSEGNSAAVFGGMDFDESAPIAESGAQGQVLTLPDGEDASDGEDTRFSSRRDLRLIDELNLRSGASPLPQTGIEAKEIGEVLGSAGVPTSVFTGSQASEEAVKGLSGRGDKLLHIATHGFYYAPGENTGQVPNAGVGKSDEELALDRSGLLFAGANRALKGDSLPPDAEDGILTAAEISHLDFGGVDMVALSACETGLGDISGEGVFGLQRGFKKAGAKSLLMSLWEVDDKATRMLMTSFYKSYLAGKSKREALRDARRELREYEEVSATGVTRRPFSFPEFWSAFILLDAID